MGNGAAGLSDSLYLMREKIDPADVTLKKPDMDIQAQLKVVKMYKEENKCYDDSRMAPASRDNTEAENVPVKKA